jgi:hypothetical protein
MFGGVRNVQDGIGEISFIYCWNNTLRQYNEPYMSLIVRFLNVQNDNKICCMHLLKHIGKQVKDVKSHSKKN